MSWSFNPFTGNLDLVGSGGGTVVFEGEVETFADLPEVVGDPPVGSSYLVRTSTGVWLVNRRQAGIWIRRNNTGVRATDWEYGGDYPVNSVAGKTGNVTLTNSDISGLGTAATANLNAISDADLRIVGSTDATKKIAIEVDTNVPTNTVVTLTAPSSGGTIARTSDIPSTFAASAVTSGVFDNARINFAAPDAIGSTTRNSGAFTTLNATNGTITASAPVLDLAQTWNNAAVTFTGMQFVVTNTASNAASLVSRFAVGASNVVETNVRGMTTFRRLGSSDLSNIVEFRLGSTLLANIRDDGGIGFGNNCTGAGCTMHDQQVRVGSGGAFVFTNASNNAFGTSDVFLRRDAADTLAQRNGTTAQTFRIYNTFTDASNYERGFMRWSSNVLQIGTEKAGTGSARALEFQTDGVTRLSVTVAGSTVLSAGNQLVFSERGRIIPVSDGVWRFTQIGDDGFGRIQFGGTTSSFPALKRSSTSLQVRLADDSAFAPLSCGALTLNGNLTASTRNIVTDTTTGTRIGTETTQLLGFWNATPAAQPAAVADATDAATVITQLNALLSRLRTIGIIAT